MYIQVEVPDGVQRIQIFYYKPTSPVLQYDEYFGDQLQSMIVKDEPCEWCEKALKNNENIKRFADFSCKRKHEQEGLVVEDTYLIYKFCPNCGRDLRKDVE